jgi:ring-1,2-phenylacetyl-CoA epoxidase subunit PaaE
MGADAWLLCGPSALVRETTSLLAELGVPAHSIHRELFSADDAGEPERPRGGTVPESDVTVVLHGERTSFHVEPSDGPILNALLPLRPDVPYACRDGVCATCRARVLEGDVTMRRSAGLDPEELRAGYVLACQAQPASERVVLDFDT